MDIVLGSNNQKKIAELEDNLPADFHVFPAAHFGIDSPPETGTTFVENAIIKARYSAQISGLPAIADDSGLEVDFLNGQPGIYSSRYAGEDATDASNNLKLLEAMEPVSDDMTQRTARYRCVIVYMRHALDPMPVIASGTFEGVIGLAPKGDQGFGYDPLFYVPHLDKTVAQLTVEEKRAISHRGQALAELKIQLAQL